MRATARGFESPSPRPGHGLLACIRRVKIQTKTALTTAAIPPRSPCPSVPRTAVEAGGEEKETDDERHCHDWGEAWSPPH